MNTNWECMYHNGSLLYFSRIYSDKVSVSDGYSIVREYEKENINGCVYNGDTLWISVWGQGNLIAVDRFNSETVILLEEKNYVRIVKAVTGQNNYLILDIQRENTRVYAIFDCELQKIEAILPITINCMPGLDTLDDLYIDKKYRGRLICEYKSKVPARYKDVLDDEEILFYAEFTWNEQNKTAELGKSIRLYIDYECGDSESGMQTLLKDADLRFPLFDNYLREWLRQKSFSSSGAYIVYYCSEISGIIIGSPDEGTIYRILRLPNDVNKEKNKFLFDDFDNMLYVIDENDTIRRYLIENISKDALDKLNVAYNEAYQNKYNLSRRRDAGDLTFWKLLNQAIDSCYCVPISEKHQKSSMTKRVYNVEIEIETPIAGEIVYEDSREVIAIFTKWNFYKTIYIDVNTRELNIIFISEVGGISKKIHFTTPLKSRYFLNIGAYFSDEEIICCCNRHDIRYFLQKHPTNIFATNQMGYVGTLEDHNFLLTILEDYYCKSVLYHGKDEICLAKCIQSIYKLAYRYNRKDAISILRNLLILVYNPDLKNLICETCIKLDEMDYLNRSVQENNFRVNIHINTGRCVNVYYNSKNCFMTKIDSYEHTDFMQCCHFRSSKTKFIMILDFGNWETMFPISVDDGINQFLFIDFASNDQIKASFYTDKYEMLLIKAMKDNNISVVFKKLYNEENGTETGYNLATIPDIATNIDSYACSFSEISEVSIPEGVIDIGEHAFEFSYLKKIILPNSVEFVGKSAFESCVHLEYVLLSNKIKSIEESCFQDCTALKSISIPGNVIMIGKNAFAGCSSLINATLQEGVKEIATGAFYECVNLEYVIIPNTVQFIDNYAFKNCEKLIIRSSAGGYAERYARKHRIPFEIFLVQEEESTMPNTSGYGKKKRLFISHSSKDYEYILAFVNLLEDIGFGEDEIVCSSIPVYCVPLNYNVYKWLVDIFQNYELHVIYMLSHNYYKSAASLNEMGAAWALKQRWTAILLPDFDFKEISGCIDKEQISIKLDEENEPMLRYRLDALKDALISEFGLENIPIAVWERKREAFLGVISNLTRNEVSAT